MKKPFYLAFIAAFLAVCLLPTAALLCGYEAENRENRPLARLTSLWGRDGLNLSFPVEFDAYFEDHFGFREEMVTAFHGLTMALFGDTLNEKVIVGKNDMLFYSETLDDYLGRNLLSEEEIARIAACLGIEQAWCKARGDFLHLLHRSQQKHGLSGKHAFPPRSCSGRRQPGAAVCRTCRSGDRNRGFCFAALFSQAGRPALP